MIFGVPVGMLELAFAVAAFVTAAELLTSQYPRTARFALQSVYFYAYVIIYGVLGAVGLALLPLVSDQVTIEGAGANNPWTKAALIGFSVKAILHIRVFSVATGPGQSFPVGLESFVQIFEPWLLRQLELDHFDRQSAFIGPRAARLTAAAAAAAPGADAAATAAAAAAAARTAAKNDPPPGFPAGSPMRAAFEADIDQAANARQVIAAYLKYCGIKLTQRTFP
jgi:hypothetical protein